MSILSKPYTFSPNTTASSSEVNANFDTLYNDYNGGISAANLADNAVTTAKITDLNVTTAKLADDSVTPAKLTSGTGSSWAWQTWSPTYSSITVGDGTVTAKYTQIGKTVHFRWTLVCGSTTSIGNSNSITLPVTAHSEYTANNARVFVGLAFFYDNGVANYKGQAYLSSTTAATVFWDASGGPTQTGAFPATEGSTDVYSITGTYEAA